MRGGAGITHTVTLYRQGTIPTCIGEQPSFSVPLTFGDEEGKVEALGVVEAGIAVGLVVLVQFSLKEVLRATHTLCYILEEMY